MDFRCFNHRNPANTIPKFGVGRLVYDLPGGEVAPDVDVKARERAAEQTKLKAAREGLDNVEGDRARILELIQKTLQSRDAYNQFLDEKHLNPTWKLAQPADRAEQLKSEIDTKLPAIPASKPFATDDHLEARRLLGIVSANVNECVAQKTALEGRIHASHEAYETLVQQHGDNLVERQRLVLQQAEQKLEYEKQDVYTRYMGHYEAIVGKDDELRTFWELPHEGYSSHREREMQQLLFAILSQNTKSFTDGINKGFILGPDFGPDPEQNRQRFPFIYERWVQKMEKGVDRSRINEWQSRVNAQQAALERDDIQDVATILADEVTWNEINLKELPAPLTGTKTAQEQEDHHKQRKDKINHYRNICLKRAREAKDERAPHIPADRYRAHAEQLQRHLDLEDAQIRLWQEKYHEDDAFRTFTRAELSKHEQWCMEQVMRQLQKAAEIVDTPIAGHGNQEPIYHAEVRRVLIAMVYQEGVASWNDGVYEDSTADEYLWMLNELAKSDHFNVNLRGKFTLQGEAKDMMMLAREGNLLHIQMPVQEKEVGRLTDKLKTFTPPIDPYAEPADNATAERQYAERVKALEAILAQEAFNAQWASIKAKLVPPAFPTAEMTALGIDVTSATAPDPNNVRTKIDEAFTKAATDELKLPAAPATSPEELVSRGKMWAEQNPNTVAGRALKVAEVLRGAASQEALHDPNGNAAKAIAELDYLRERERLRVWKRDLKVLEKHIQNPKSKEAQDFIEAIRTRPNVEGQYGGSHIDQFASFSNGVEFNYNLFDQRDKSNLDYLDRMGIHAETLYQNYLAYIAKDKNMKVDKWDDQLIHSDWNEFKKLADMFEAIIPETEGGGKQDFLVVFPMLYKGSPERLTRTENRDQEAVVRSIYNVMKEEMKRREEVAGATKRGEGEVLAKLEGVNIGDKLLDAGRGVWSMVLSGDPVRMAAGLGVVFGLYKGARMAIKGERSLGKLLQVGGIGLILEITMKELTGRGLLDRTGAFDTLGEAIEGTYEAVLVQRGERWMKEFDISKEQHTAALYELNPVPFEQAMEWYNNTDKYGNPLPGSKADQAWDKMQMDVERINANRKIRWTAKDEEGEARFIVKRSMENFFRYVTDKDGYTAMDHGRFALEERWIQAIKDPSFTQEKAKRTRFLLPDEARQRLRANPKAITWQMVRNAEIDVSDVEKTIGQNWKNRAADTITGAAYDVYRWGRNAFDSYISPVAEDFFHTLKDKAGDVKRWLGDMGEAGAVKLHFTKENVELWYDANKYTIRHFMDDHIELVVDGVKLPFQILYGIDKAVIPWAVTKLRQFRETFRSDQLSTTKNGPLALDDIGIRSQADVVSGATLPIETKIDNAANPGWQHFGHFQESFERAFVSSKDYYELNDPTDQVNHRVGYFISRVKKEDVGWTTQTDTTEMMYKMESESYEKAIAEFVKHGASSREEVIKLMYPIHVIVNRGNVTGQKTPEEMYTFWRMPLPGSTEYGLKTAPGNRWPDYMDPNEFKHRPPFRIDPSKTLLENLKRAAGLHLEKTRVVGGGIGIFFAQWLRIALWPPEKAGKLIGAARGIPKLGEKIKPIVNEIEELSKMDEVNKQRIDEFLTSAETHEGAVSEFYGVKANAWWYKAALAYARNYVNVYGESMPLYLGHLDSAPTGKGFTGTRESTDYTTTPSGWNDANFYDWVDKHFKPKHPGP